MEQKYFIFLEGEKKGPLSINELKTLQLKSSDLIWYEGLDGWKSAESVQELKELFTVTPPPLPVSDNNSPVYVSREFTIQQKNGYIEYLSNNTLRLLTRDSIIYYRYANFGERFAARLLDVLIIIIPAAIIPLLPSWLYFSLQHSSDSQQTLGQKALNIKLLSADGAKVTFGQATGRFFANILNALTLFIGYFMFFFSDKNQCLHDNLAGTLVVSELRRENKR